MLVQHDAADRLDVEAREQEGAQILLNALVLGSGTRRRHEAVCLGDEDLDEVLRFRVGSEILGDGVRRLQCHEKTENHSDGEALVPP